MDDHPEPPAKRKVIYGGRVAEVTPADGVSGILCRSSGGRYFFRIYRGDGEFDDYDLLHDDLSVTIDPDALASFYRIEGKPDGVGILDHRPETFGLKEIKPDES